MGSKTIVYLSGGITKNANYKRDFKRGEYKMRSAGFEVINPVKTLACVNLNSHEDYMHISRAWVEVADAIFMLCGWTSSEGAIEEYRHAKTLNKSILFEDGAERNEDYEKIAQEQREMERELQLLKRQREQERRENNETVRN